MQKVSMVVVVDKEPVVGEQVKCTAVTYYDGSIVLSEIVTLPVKNKQYFCLHGMGFFSTFLCKYIYLKKNNLFPFKFILLGVNTIPKVGENLRGTKIEIYGDKVTLKPCVTNEKCVSVRNSNGLVFVKTESVSKKYMCIVNG